MNRTIMLPGAIVLAGVILAIAVYLVRVNDMPSPETDLAAMRPVSTTDHMIGNPTAPVVIVEYSDIDCSYCKEFQRTMSQIMSEYGPTGQVAWVYRHFPLVHIHENAGAHAEASECVASIGGPETFWQFIDAIHAAAPNSTEFNPAAYVAFLPQFGVSEAEFTACMDEGRFVKKVEADLENALTIGATATPFSIILIEGQNPISLSGALPYAGMKEVIETALEKAGR